jgi:hypothetical protein
LADERHAEWGHGRAWAVLGQYVSWTILLGIPLISTGVAVAALSDRIALNPVWTFSSLIMVVVFVHGATRVRWDLAEDRASSQADNHRSHPG